MEKLQAATATRLAWRLTTRAVCGLILLCTVFSLACLVVLRALREIAECFGVDAACAAFSFVAGGGGSFVAWRVGGVLCTPQSLPHGLLLVRERLPSLHAFVDALGRRCGGFEVDAVWLTADFNAAVLRRPRWGMFGRLETHLLIGLPLANSLSEREFAAILAHEYGHVRETRRRRDAWGTHLRSWWFRAIDRCIEVMPPFAPALDRLTAGEVGDALRLACYEEFAADRSAARIVGAQLMADTLHAVASSAAGLYGGDDAEVAEVGLHPSLNERCAALGCRPDAGQHSRGASFAELHFGSLLPELADALEHARRSV